ncbi:MAG: carboxypeptidase-like regulatory domain-containing protein, partial [Tannerellaceae bacterium]
MCLCLALCSGIALPEALAAAPMDKEESVSISQQVRKLTGVITDQAGIPIIGANVIEKGTTNGTITNIDGQFSLEVSANATLQVSYIGYLDKQIPVGNQSVFTLQLLEDTQNLDEVVVVGYGTQKKVNLTGAVSNIKAEMLENRTTPNTVNMLTGQVSGVTIVQNSGQ